jgi:hypothetical protein
MDTSSLEALHWRLIGSFRAGRVSAVAGLPDNQNVYYFGTPGGGIWKTTDADTCGTLSLIKSVSRRLARLPWLLRIRR